MKKNKIITILVTVIVFISVLIINPIANAKENISLLRTNQTSSFSDINENDWYFDNVNYLVGQKLINGYMDRTFKPNQTIAVSEFITIIVKSLNYETILPSAENWYQQYVDEAVKLGIIDESDFNSNDYNRNITRGEMAKIVIKALEIKENISYVNSEQYISQIADYDSIYEELKPYILKAYVSGIIGGYTDGTFKVNQTATRAEACAVIERYINVESRSIPSLIPITITEPVLLYVNGNKISTAPYVENGVTYIPLQSVVEGMGDKYEWNKTYRSATVTIGEKKVQLISGKSIMFVNGKYMSIATKLVNSVAVPLNIKAVYKDGVFFVPLNVITDILGYKVDTSERTNIYVGTKPVDAEVKDDGNKEEPKPAEPVKPTEPVESESTGNDIATTDNIQKLVDIGFVSLTKTGAFYNSDSPEHRIGANLTIGSSAGEWVIFTISNWESKTPEMTKKALNVYLPNDGDTIYSSVRVVTDKIGRLLIQIFN